jgi:hypothetical protein
MENNMPQDNLSFIQRLAENGIFGYLWLLFISLWGGTVSYIEDVRKGAMPTFINWLYKACTSGFVGVITAMICQYYKLDSNLTAALTGVASYNGTQTLVFIIEAIKKNSSVITFPVEQCYKSKSILAMKSKKENKNKND